jgi:NAD(P)-dependent dehydrogenase (short-subunit alcohol dehydrogenase family)
MTASSAGASLTPEGSAYRTYVEATAAGDGSGEPDDLVGPLLLLCSPAGRWITGQVLHVDGGLIIRS